MKQDTFVMDRYDRKPTFSSFLPGIAGEHGIPVWCYYNNRGQAVCSFGVRDKDHSIMEFSAAHRAYQEVQRTGFRTFFKRDGKLTEAFTAGECRMDIRPNELCLSWTGSNVSVDVTYFVLPECPVGALARSVTLTNHGPAAQFSLLDGMPALVPYGVDQDALKNMTQLAKAFMQVEDVAEGLAFYRTRASMADTAVVTAVEGGNFALGLTENGARLPAIADPEAVFGYDTALEKPHGFARPGFAARVAKQATQNIFPCAFFAREASLAEGESLTLNELYGQAENKQLFRDFAGTAMDAAWFAAKRARANALSAGLTAAADTRTADPVFDGYCRQTYLDNLLRGGEPVRFGDNIFYVYSRKHGDPEREYNYFVMSPEYYSQGNGNYRDVNQNRRSDVLFHPWVGDANIRLFFSLLQSDGYNPLVIDRMTYRAPCAPLDKVAEADRAAAAALLGGEFTPGELAMAAEHWRYQGTDAAAFVADVLAGAKGEPNATFQEGYWSDHWTYDLDLIESYLAVWPERRQELLLGARDYPWYETRTKVLPRDERYEAGRQVHFLDKARKANTTNKWMRENFGEGEVARSTLLEKMILLCTIKYATLDKAGIGIEMEGGKPGWYDALNGLPALSGSSVAESCELARLLAFTAEALEGAQGQEINLYSEMADLIDALDSNFENRSALRDEYRDQTAEGVDGRRTTHPAAALAKVLRRFEKRVRAGLAEAVRLGEGICPCYLMFPQGAAEPLPLFLEGPVRWLKQANSPAAQKRMAAKVRRSGLYDRKLSMYKVNESLSDLTFEAGRTKAFTPGWLENESIWLHMEYKYLLELLRAGLYPEYEQAFNKALVPFLNPDVYGRSTLENVSFLASGANPDPKLHGRGFVSRLSGSTAEFLQMWQWMFFGPTPVQLQDGKPVLTLAPMLPARLIPDDGVVEAVLFGACRVRYHIPGKESVVPGQYTIEPFAADVEALRRGEVKELDIYLKR